MHVRNLRRLSLLLGLGVAISGCFGGGAKDAPKTVKAKGIVTYKGQPMENLSVAFMPDKGLPAMGKTDAAGKFTLTTSTSGDGAVPGPYKVAISFAPPEGEEIPGPGDPVKPVPSPIPKKYGHVNTTDIVITVDKDASKNDFKIELTD